MNEQGSEYRMQMERQEPGSINLKRGTMKDKAFYVGIREKAEIRKDLLESSKAIIHILRDFDTIKAKRQEKLERTNELRNTIREIYRATFRLRMMLPKVELEKETISREIRTAKKSAAEKQEKKQRSPKEMDRLEQELSQIEAKLAKLG